MTEPAASGTLLYLDSSALVKLVVAEAESAALVTFLVGWPFRITSALAAVEVVRAARRATDDAAVHRRAEDVVARIGLVPVDLDVLHHARTLGPGGLRTLDAVHLASALSVGGDLGVMVVYDRRLADAATDAGVAVARPGDGFPG